MGLDYAVDISCISILCSLILFSLTNLALEGRHAEGDLPKACCQIGAAL